MSIKIEICPFCGSENIEWVGDAFGEETPFHCHECDRWFNEKEAYREFLRHEMSALIMDTSKHKPKPLNVTIGEEEAVGLSSLELPLVTSVFQDNEGIIWFNIYGAKEPMEFDDLSTSELETILNELK